MPVAGGPFIQKTGILLEVDSADKTSYSGTGTTWINQVRPGTNNGTLNNISFDSADAKGALVFTGSNTFVDFGNLGPSLTSSFSFQVAFEPAATASGQPYTILSYASASSTSSITFKLDYTSSNQTVVLTTFSNTGSQNIVYVMSASANSGSWNIVHGTFGTQLAALYVNGLGQAYAPTTGSTTGYNASNRLYAGLNFGSTSGYYTGSIGNIIVNNADLGGLDINRNYNAIASRFSLPARRPLITDADAFAFFERTGGTLSVLEQQAINQLVLDLKSYGIWAFMKAIYPMVGASAAACAQNLRSSSFTGVFNGGWTFSSTGVTGNGTNGFFDTLFVISDNLSFDSQSYTIYKASVQNATIAEFGVNLGDNTGTGLYLKDGYGHINTFITNQVFSSSLIAGNYILNRPNGTTKKLFRNGVLFETRSDTALNLNYGTRRLYLSGRNDNNAGAVLVSNTQTRFFSIGDGLTDTQANNFYTAIQAFQTTLGRQV